MKVRSWIFIASIVLPLLLMITPNVAKAQDISVVSCYADSEINTQEASKACDGNTGFPPWTTPNTPFPHWLQANLTTTSIVDGARIYWGGYGVGNFKIQYWNGAAWIDDGSFNADGKLFLTVSYTLTTGVSTSKIRIYGTHEEASWTGLETRMNMFEVVPFNTRTFLVLNDAGCVKTAIATNANCWAASSGGTGGVGVPGLTSRIVLDSNSGTGTGVLNANMNVKSWCMNSACGGTGNFGATLDLSSRTIYVHGDWNSNGGTITYGTGKVVLGESGTLSTKNSGVYGYKDLYRMAINTSATITFDTPIGIADRIWINGTLVSSASDPQRLFSVFGVSGTNTPVSIGASGNVAGSGYFFYSDEAAANFYVAGAMYQHLGVRGSPNQTATLAGAISTPLCGVFSDCAIIFTTIVPHNNFNVDSAGYSITSGGNFWIGDGVNFPASFYARGSRIEAYGISPTGPGTVYWGSSTIIAHPSQGTLPFHLGYYQNGGSIAYLQTAKLYANDSEVNVQAGSHFYVNSSTFNFVVLTIFPLGFLHMNSLIGKGFLIAIGDSVVNDGPGTDFAHFATLLQLLSVNNSKHIAWKISTTFQTSILVYDFGGTIAGDFYMIRIDSDDRYYVQASAEDGFGSGGARFTASTPFAPGTHTVAVTTTIAVVLTNLFDYAYLLSFVFILTIGFIGAFAIKRKRGH